MADSKISALPAAGTLADADVFALVNGGGTTSVSLNTLTAYFEARSRQNNASTANQSFTTADTYVTGSYITIPAGRLQAKAKYHAVFEMNKTSAAGTATPVITVRLGPAGATSDTARCTLTFPAQTAVADSGVFETWCTFRAVGSGTTAVLQAVSVLYHGLSITGLSTSVSPRVRVTSAGFDSTVASLGIGFSFNGGTSFAGNTDLVQADLSNLA